jgi:hypothetical protein
VRESGLFLFHGGLFNAPHTPAQAPAAIPHVVQLAVAAGKLRATIVWEKKRSPKRRE